MCVHAGLRHGRARIVKHLTNPMADNRKINLEWIPSAYRQAIDKNLPAESHSAKPGSYTKKGFGKASKRKSFLGK